MSNFDAKIIEEKIGYCFENKSLLKLAFTHSSYANENKAASNEKLEFLGDSILNFCIAEYLFRKGGGSEGTLSVMRSKIVSEPPLAKCVDGLDIISHLICGVGEERNNPHKSDAVKADLFEAVVGAVYLDSGDVSVCEKFITGHLSAAISDALEGRTPLKYTFKIIEKKPKTKPSQEASKEHDTLLKPLKPPKQPKRAGKKEVREEKTEEKRKPGKKKDGEKSEPEASLKKEKKVKERKSKGKEKEPELKDYKSALQNYLQAERRAKPEYVVTEQSGSAHAPLFNVDVIIDGKIYGSGAGGRKKDAEQAAAQEAYKKLGRPRK